MPNQLRFSLPGNKDSVNTVRAAISNYAKSLGFSEEAVEDIGISVTEGCRIICCHGYERMACRFLVVCGMNEGTLHLKISNNNAEFTIEKEECDRCTHCTGDGDLSLFILSSLMDKAELEENVDGAKNLVMEKIKNSEE
jgi:anti-sigma regulatory factor (Ser/Thr protein kinase)